MHDLKELMREQYLKYASYVILDRAIPRLADGLKPVQRRILHTLFEMHDGKFHKVANVVGQTMAYHPHGDAAIYEALVALANKGYLLDCQGNFGNLLTDDPPAAARYIETRLSPLAVEVLFNPKITAFTPSYDGRREEPITLPAKIPLLLLQGTEGIAVGMSTKILPHNFQELLEAEIAILEERPFLLVPDFPTGASMDASEYADGKGKVRLRAKIDIVDQKTLYVRELCFGTTTESLIRSIDDAARKGKIKLDSISDYSTDKVEIEIKLSRGQYADDILEQLLAYTECQVSLSSQMCVVTADLPQEMSVSDILRVHVELLQSVLKQELELEAKTINHEIFCKTLEQVFIENRLYKHIEESKSQEAMYEILKKSIEPFTQLLERAPLQEDYERLLQIPIRRIARFDIQKNQQDIASCQKKLQKVHGHLKKLKAYTISYIKSLLEQYGHLFPRRTQMIEIKQVDKKAIATKDISVGVDLANGYIGTKVESSHKLSCTLYDKVLLFYKSGLYKVVSPEEKLYVGIQEDILLYAGVVDKSTIFSCSYKEKASGIAYAKRFIIKQFILEKEYRFFDEGNLLLFFTDKPEVSLLVHLVPKPRQKQAAIQFDFKNVGVKAVTAYGVRVSPRPVLHTEQA